jgi:hypothetical protein
MAELVGISIATYDRVRFILKEVQKNTEKKDYVDGDDEKIPGIRTVCEALRFEKPQKRLASTSSFAGIVAVQGAETEGEQE